MPAKFGKLLMLELSTVLQKKWESRERLPTGPHRSICMDNCVAQYEQLTKSESKFIAKRIALAVLTQPISFYWSRQRLGSTISRQ